MNIIETATFNSRRDTIILSSFCFLWEKATRQRISALLYILSALNLNLVVTSSRDS